MSLAPGLAFAGPGGAACDSVAPNWNVTTGSSGLWFLNNVSGTSSGVDQDAGVTTGSGPLPTLINPTFSLLGDDVLGYPDLNGDGITDVVMVASTGFTFGYILQDNGGGFLNVATSGPLPALINPDYRYVGLPDLNGDGKTDLCQIHTGGFTFCYLMDGLTTLGSGPIDGPINTDFRIIGFTDLDNLNGDDTVIQSNTGFTYSYLLVPDGTFVQTGDEGATGSLINTDFSTIGFPDLNGDDKSDILIQSDTGFTYAFLQDGITLISKQSINGLINTDFVTLGFPDMDGDGNSDHVIASNTGFTYAYLQEPDGGTGVQLKAEGTLDPPVSSVFERRGFPDLDCDGDADITYQADTGFTLGYLAGDSGLADTSTQVTLSSAPPGSVTRDWAQSWAVLPDPFLP
jgi:hypothetical protein